MACDAATVANKASVGVVHHSRLQTAADQLLHAAVDEPALGLALQDYAWAASSDAKDLAFLPAFTVVGPARAASCSAICPATRLPRPPWTSELPRELGRAKEERGVLRRLMMSVRLPVCWAAWPARAAGAVRKFRGREFLCEPLFSCSQRRLARPCLLTTGGHTRPLPTRLAVA